MIVELLGLAYAFGKDLKDYLEWEEKPKQVTGKWLEQSGFAKQQTDAGFELRWTKPERIPERDLEGWTVVHELDQKKRIRYRLVLSDGLTLIGRPRDERQ